MCVHKDYNLSRALREPLKLGALPGPDPYTWRVLVIRGKYLTMSVRRVRSRLRRRRYCITLNNPTVSDCLRWDAVLLEGNLAEAAQDLTFFIVQTEKGESGTVHYQGYVELKRAVEWSVIKRIFGERIHVEASRGNAMSNIRYCTKLEGRYVDDETICLRASWGRAKRSSGDIMCAVKIMNGAKLKDIVKDHPLFVLKNKSKVEAMISYVKGPRMCLPKMTILIGKTGVGKSRYVLEKFGSGAYWVDPPADGKVWFGGYCGQDVAVFDDFHAGWFQLTHLLRIMDRYPLQVAPKGGQVPFNSGTMVFTSNVDCKDWYKSYSGLPEHKEALERRIREYCKIYDCTHEMWGEMGSMPYPHLRPVLREGSFKFRKEYDFSLQSSGSFNQGVGNGNNNPFQHYGSQYPADGTSRRNR